MVRGSAGSLDAFGDEAPGASGASEFAWDGLLTRAGRGVATTGRAGLIGMPSSSIFSATSGSFGVLAGRNIKVRKVNSSLALPRMDSPSVRD